MAQSSEQAPLISAIVGSIPTSDSGHLREELVNALPTVVSLRRVLRFGKIDRMLRLRLLRLANREPELKAIRLRVSLQLPYKCNCKID